MKILSFFRKRWLEHVNPDGSKGGVVSVNAEVGENTFIPSGAIVGRGAKVNEKMNIKDGDYVLSDNSVVRSDGMPARKL